MPLGFPQASSSQLCHTQGQLRIFIDVILVAAVVEARCISHLQTILSDHGEVEEVSLFVVGRAVHGYAGDVGHAGHADAHDAHAANATAFHHASTAAGPDGWAGSDG